jgi:multidrug efflux system outer membrane protein
MNFSHTNFFLPIHIIGIRDRKTRAHRHYTRQAFSAAALVLILGGCAIKRAHYDVPDIPLPSQFAAPQPENSLSGDEAAPLDNVLPKWWRLLGNQELDALVDRALANNLDLRIATSRIAQARARSEQVGADRFPSISIPLQVRSEAPEGGIGTVAEGGKIITRHTYQAAVRADWRPDLWGEVQSEYESSDLQLWRATFQRDDIQRALVANVASTYADYLSLRDRMRITEESEMMLSALLASVQERMEKGDATVIDFEQQRSAVYQVRAVIPSIRLQRNQILNHLATLVGAVPGGLTLSEDSGLDALGYPIVVPGIPTALLLRRPDVRVLEATMLAADANIDVARARILPPLDLTAQRGTGSYQFARLFQPATLFWTGIASLSANIFDFGKRSSEVAYAREVHEELVESYVRTLFSAVREVEDAQSGIELNGQRFSAQKESVASAQRAWNFSRESYDAGAIDYLTLLDTERNYHAKLDELYRIRLSHYRSMIDLFQALGGGVETGGKIPGKGKRPLPLTVADAGLILSTIPPLAAEEPLVESKLLEAKGEHWLIELPSVASRTAIAATSRDLHARFAGLMEQRVVLSRQLGSVLDSAKIERSSWYRLFVGVFQGKDLAEQFCNALKLQQMRCKVFSSQSSEFSAGGKWMEQKWSPPIVQPKDGPVTSQTSSDANDEKIAIRFAVQVDSALIGNDNPEKLMDVFRQRMVWWKNKGYEPYLYQSKASREGGGIGIRIGNFVGRKEAQELANTISKKFERIAVVTPIILKQSGPTLAMEAKAYSSEEAKQ